jgi:hypothetical protein
MVGKSGTMGREYSVMDADGSMLEPVDMDGFQVDPEETCAQWEEAITMVPRIWTEAPLSHTGRCYQGPPRSIVSKPVQKPHPPLWVACSQPDSFRAAGEMGLGALCFNLGGYAQTAERVGLDREGIRPARPVGRLGNDQIATPCVTQCAETDAVCRWGTWPTHSSWSRLRYVAVTSLPLCADPLATFGGGAKCF